MMAYLFGKGFKGGPDSRLNRNHHCNLSGIDFEITLPDSNVVISEPEKAVNIPFKSSGWFNNNCEQTSNHCFVSLPVFRRWVYLGPFWKVFNDPFGSLVFDVWVKKTLPETTLEVDNLETLEAAINKDYRDYFESETPGKYGQGKNFQVRQEAQARYSASHWQNEVGRQQMKAYIKNRIQELPSGFEIHKHDTINWLFYSLAKEPNYPKHHYCVPLDDRYYLDVSFLYAVDFPQYFHIWQAHAEQAEQRIMASIRLNYGNHIEASKNR